VPRLLLGVSGGIAAYKALELVRLATAEGHAVRVIQTEASLRFVGAASFAALSGAPVLSEQFERDPLRGSFPGDALPTHDPASHLALSAAADVFLIAPASANTLAKLANGLADNLLSAAALAARCPLIVAPAMNDRMWSHPATQANVAALRERGVTVLAPGSGRLATEGEWGEGRMAEPAQLLEALHEVLGWGRWRGTRTLVTAGGTREPIDSVRFLGNSSSGRMGVALARAARERGAEVTLVAANVALETPDGVARVEVGSAADLKDACEREFPGCDVLLMAAAVADFTPAQTANGKLKKSERDRLELVLEPTADILAGLAAHRRDGQTLFGFAAEHGEGGLEHARAKLAEKRLDAIVYNDISRSDIGFDVDANEVTIISGAGAGIEERHVARTAKTHVAEAILDAVERVRAGA
jgi:phosphopantothenoylcysteine decarboxylase / phosphopantothenate---cysteine ligase